jgi:hypothetical protein
MTALPQKRAIVFEPHVRPVYAHLEPIVDLLLTHGNRLAHKYRWGENRTGPFCHFSDALNFDLIENTFEIPPYIRLDRQNGSIECDQTWACIVGGVHAAPQ